MPSDTTLPRNGVQVIARAADILRVLAAEPGGLTLGRMAAKLSLPRSTVHRIVKALESEGLVVPRGGSGGGFRLGPELARLTAASREKLIDVVRPHLEELSRLLRETVDLAVLDGQQVRFVDQVAAPRRLRAVSAVGAMFPLHCTANGKALLAALPAEQVQALLPARLERHTARTITRRADLLAELERVRGEGVAFDREEHTEGICAVGAVVWDALGEFGAVTVPLPAQRFYGNEDSLAAALRKTVARISATLGADDSGPDRT